MSKVSHDKLLHFFYGAIVVFVLSHLVPNAYTIAITITIAILKEVYDKYNNGTTEWRDVLFTCLPLLFLI